MGPSGSTTAPPAGTPYVADVKAQAQDPKFVVSDLGSGLPWWIWIVGGAALYLVFGKKKKGRK